MVNISPHGVETNLDSIHHIFGANAFDRSIPLANYERTIETNPGIVASLEGEIVGYISGLNIPREHVGPIVDKLEPEVLSLCGLTGMVGSAELESFLPGMSIMSLVLLIDELMDSSSGSYAKFLPLITSLIENKTENKDVQGILDLVNKRIDAFNPEDRTLVRQLTFRYILLLGFEIKNLSQGYEEVKHEQPDFIVDHEQEIIQKSIEGIGLVPTAFLIFLELKKHGIVTSELNEVAPQYQRLIGLLSGYLRLLDDYKDQEGDLNHMINICGTQNGQLILPFMLYCKVDPEGYVPGDNTTLFKPFVREIRQEVARIGEGTVDGEIFKNILLKIATVFSLTSLKDPALRAAFASEE